MLNGGPNRDHPLKGAEPLSRTPRVKLSSDKKAPPAESPLLTRIVSSLDDDKAEDIVKIDLSGRSSLCDVIVHLFRAEVRSYYDLEGMWSVGEAGTKAQKPERVGSAA